MRALVIEDNYQIARLDRNALQVAGFDVDIVPSGTEALRLLAEDAYELDVVVIDRCLADISGDVIVEESRRRRPMTAVIVTTGSVPDVAPACDALLLKPFRMSDLVETVSAAIAARRRAPIETVGVARLS